MMESNLHALVGAVTCAWGSTGSSCSSSKPSSSAIFPSGRAPDNSALGPRALSKLAGIIDTCNGAEFLQLIRKQGVLVLVGAAHQNVCLSLLTIVQDLSHEKSG